MMKIKKNKNQDNLIDKYYNEDFDKKYTDDDKFYNEIDESLDKMNVIKDIDCDMDIDISEIIESAETIKNKRKRIIENIAFAIISIIIFSAFAFTAASNGMKFIVIYEITIITLIPFTLIPISMIELKGGKQI